MWPTWTFSSATRSKGTPAGRTGGGKVIVFVQKTLQAGDAGNVPAKTQ